MRISFKSIPYLFLSIFLLASCGGENPGDSLKSSNNKSAGPPAANVEITVAKDTTIKNLLAATGTILANEEVELRSEVSGRVISINFDEGSKVSKGQLLVKIDNSEQLAQLQRLNTQLELAKTEEGRQKKLLEIEAISQGEYDVVANRRKTLEAERKLIVAQLNKTEIRAPFSGVIGLRDISEGSYVSPSTRIALLQQLDPVKIEFSIPESYSTKIKDGSTINFKVSGSNVTHSGTVYAHDLSVDPATRTIKLRARSKNPDRELVPGTFAKIELNLGEIKNTIMIPAQAIIPELNGQKVFTIENGQAKSATVNTGIRTENMVQITDGLSRGDSVVTSGILQLKEGSKVNVKGGGS